MPQDNFLKWLGRFVIILGAVFLLALFIETMQWVNFFALSGHDLIMATITFIGRYLGTSLVAIVNFLFAVRDHFIYFNPLYIIASAVIGIPTGVYHFKRYQWKTLLSQRDVTLKNLQNRTKEERIEHKILLQRYDDLKKHIIEVVRPCAKEIVFDADDKIILRHPLCYGLLDLEAEIRKEHKKNFRLTQELSTVSRKATKVIPTPRHTEAMRCQEIETLKAHVERLELEASLRAVDNRELRVKLGSATKYPATSGANTKVEQLEERLRDKVDLLREAEVKINGLKKAGDKIREERDASKADLQAIYKLRAVSDTENGKVGKELKEAKADLEAVAISKSALETEIKDLKNALQDSNSKIEKLERSAKDDKLAHVKLLDEKQKELENSHSKVAALEFSRQAFVDAPNALSTHIDDSQAIRGDLEKVKIQNSGLENALQKAKKQHEQDLSTAKAEAEKWYRASQVTTGADVRASQEYQDLLVRARKIQEEHNQLRETSRNLEQERDSRPTIDVVRAAEEKHTKLCEQLQRKDQELDQNTQQLKKAAEIFKTKEHELNELRTQNHNLAAGADNGTYASKFKEAQQTITAQESEIVDLKKRIDILAFGLEDNDCEFKLKNAQDTIEVQGKQISEMWESCMEAEQNNKSLTQHISDREVVIKQKDQLIRERDERIANQEKTIQSFVDSMSDDNGEAPLLDLPAMITHRTRDADALRGQVEVLSNDIALKYDELRSQDQTIRALKAETAAANESQEKLLAETLQNAIRIEELDEIERALRLYAPPDIHSDASLSAQINILASRAQDAHFAYARLSTAGLVNPQNGDRLDQHVAFALTEIERHRAGAADFYNIVVAVENELDRKFGERPQGTKTGHTALVRVKRLIDRK